MKKYILVLIIGVLLVPFVSSARLAFVSSLNATEEQNKEAAQVIIKMNEAWDNAHAPVDTTTPPTKETLPTITPSEPTVPFTPPQPEPEVTYNPSEGFVPAPTTLDLPQGGVEPDTTQEFPKEIPAIAHVPVFTTFLSVRTNSPDKVPQIKALQSLLIYLGNYWKLDPSGKSMAIQDWHPQEEIDGKFGNKTLNALMNFQSIHNLVPDGKFGPLTRAVAEVELEKIQNGN